MDTALWMARDLLTATPDTPLAVAARQMAARHVRHLLVVADDDARRLVGLVSSHDLFLAADAGVHPNSPRAVDGDERTLADIMTLHPATIPSTTSIAEAARILRDRKFGCLPVVDRGELVGVLTEHDILRAFLRMAGADQPGYEVTAIVGDTTDVLGTLHSLAERRHLRLVSASVFDHDRRRYAVVHFVGGPDDAFVESLWRSGLTILRVRAATEAAAFDASR
ncbi:MAG: CBS domain-containing protein [Planctomycetes bacterium]|nr:CBS domain-containing protein [Planctomycetota bacterium]